MSGPYTEIDLFTITFTGYFVAPTTEAYTFHLENDDVVIFILDFQTLASNNGFIYDTPVRLDAYLMFRRSI
jgi:hypothetical protein